MTGAKKRRFQRPPWQRMMWIHERIKSRSYPNCVSMAREMGVAAMTVKRDVRFMVGRLKMPLKYDREEHGYYYSRPVDKFPRLPISEADLFGLLVAHKALACYHGTPLEKPLTVTFQKFTGQLDGKERYSVENLEELMASQPFSPADADLETYRVIIGALQGRRALEFQYREPGAKTAQRQLVQPCNLACVGNQWTLIAYDVKRKAIRRFALVRLTAPKRTARRIAVPKGFDPDAYLKGPSKVSKRDMDNEVVVEFDAWATAQVRTRQWHASQKFTELPNGRSRLQFRLEASAALERWVLSWGAHATVVRPRILVERIRATAKGLATRYA